MVRLPTFSILLPVYNGQRYLIEAIESALSQSFSDFELLIADDCSNDQSSKIIDTYARKDSRIIAWRNENNLGLFGNYNACLKRASGRLIKPFAQDDFFAPNILAEFRKIFEKFPKTALVSCARRTVNQDGKELKVLRSFRSDKQRSYAEVLEDNLLTLANDIGEPSTVAFQTAFAGDGFDESLYHLGDVEFWFRIIERGNYYYLNEVLCNFRTHEGSTTSKNARGLRFALDMIKLGQKYRSYLDSIGISEDAYSRLTAEATATHVKFLTRHRGISLRDLLAVEHETTESMVNDMSGFKELLFYALMLAGETLEENYALKQEWEAERNRLEDKIANLVASRSWKLTVPLRGAIKILRSYSAKN